MSALTWSLVCSFIAFYVMMLFVVAPWLIRLVSCKGGHELWWFACRSCKEDKLAPKIAPKQLLRFEEHNGGYREPAKRSVI